MDQITLKSEQPGQTTCIANQFIDEYMPSANGEYVKVYIYLLRYMSDNQLAFSLSGIIDTFEYTQRDLMRALEYWERMGLLELTYNSNKQLSGITLLSLSGSHTPSQPPRKRVEETTPLNNTDSESKQSREYTADELKAFSDKEDVSELLFIAENYVKHPLTRTEINTFLFWYDTLKFPIELIEYLVEYCVNRGHKSIRYMDKVALSWDESGIRTVDQAKKTANLYSQANYAVIKALGIKGRNLVDLETSMIEKWTKKYHFSLDVITEACTRTISATHQPSFEYADRILTNWHKAKVKELSDIEELDASFRKNKKQTAPESTNTRSVITSKASVNQFNNFSQRSYDYEQLEQQMLNRNRN